MADKHQLMARLQAARHTSGRIAEAESQKAYPDTKGKEKAEDTSLIPLPMMELQPGATPVAASPSVTETGYPDRPGNESPAVSDEPPGFTVEKPPKKEHVTYTTISVPKQYGYKAKVYASLMNLNMVEFACQAVDAYILQLQEAGKLPRMNL